MGGPAQSAVSQRYRSVVLECEYEYAMRFAYRSGKFNPDDEQIGVTQFRTLSSESKAQAIGLFVQSQVEEAP